MAALTTTATGATTAPVALTVTDQARVEQALADSRAVNTRRQYRSAWTAWTAWARAAGHHPLPASPESVAAYLASLAADGKAASTIATARAAIGAAHRDARAADPTAHEGVRRVLKGLRRQAAGRGRGQAAALSADDAASILATAHLPRRTGRGTESAAAAAERAAVDKAVVALLFHAGLRRSEAAALRWADVTDGAGGSVLVQLRRSKTDQAGERVDVRLAKNGCARALRDLRARRTAQAGGSAPPADEQVLGGLTGESVARRLSAAAAAAGVEGRVTGHSGRVGLAVELTARGASTTETMLAGGWQSARMVARYGAAATAERGAVAKYL